jgi:serine/threonine protein kinase
MNDVASLRPALQALRDGKIAFDELTGQLEFKIVNSLDSADDFLRQIDDAYRDELLNEDYFSRLKSFVVSTVTTHDPNLTRLDLTQLINDSQMSPSTGFSQHNASPTTDGSTDDRVSYGTGVVGIGTVLRDRFRLEEVLGVGGMGTVYRGVDIIKMEARDREPYIAIKVLNNDFRNRPDAFIALQREASRQQRLAHPHIATVYDFDRSGQTMFITMELLEGQPLDKFIKAHALTNGGLPLGEALRIIENLSAALGYAHEHGLVHGDFKPSNCFINKDNRVKIFDFGIARVMKIPGRSDQEDTMFDGAHVGAMTPAYASPEMLLGTEPPDPRDDIYALACVSYQLLTGRHPMNYLRADEAQKLNMTPPRVKRLSRQQNLALRSALAFERAQRVPSVSEFLDRLKGDSNRNLKPRHAAIAGGAALVLAALAALPGFLERREIDELVGRLRSGDATQIETAIVQTSELNDDVRQRVLIEVKPALFEYYLTRFNSMTNAKDSDVPYAAVSQMITSAQALYPDSNSLAELAERLLERRESHLGALSRRFENFLATGPATEDGKADDIHELLRQVQAVDPASPLLTDNRLPGVFAKAVEDAIQHADLDRARRLLNEGLRIAAQDLMLVDISDRLTRAEVDAARIARVTALTTELRVKTNAVQKFTDLTTLSTTAGSLAELDATNSALLESGARVRKVLTDELAGLLDHASLPAVSAALGAREVLGALGLGSITAALVERQTHLEQQRATLIADIKLAISLPNMTIPTGEPVAALLRKLAASAPELPDTAELTEQAISTRRERARALQARQRWQAASEELAAAQALDQSSPQSSDILREIADLDESRQAAAERAASTANQLAAQQRLDQVIGARNALTALVDRFNVNADNLSEARKRIAVLADLEPNDPLLATATNSITESVVAASEKLTHDAAYERALTLLDDAEHNQFKSSRFPSLRESTRAAQKAAALAEQRVAFDQQRERLYTLLQDSPALEQPVRQREVLKAIGELAALATDPQEAAKARKRTIDAFLSTAATMITAKRFAAAQQIIDQAGKLDDGNTVTEARDALAAAESQYKSERAAQEREAQIASAKQRFLNEVRAKELEKSQKTLRELRAAALENDAFAIHEGPQMLATAFGDRAKLKLDQRNLSAAAQAIQQGLGLMANDKQLLSLRDQVEAFSTDADIRRRLQQGDVQSRDATRALMARTKALDPDAYESREREWAETAGTRLKALRNDPKAFNAWLATARALLPNQSALIPFEPISLTPLAPPIAPVPSPTIDAPRVAAALPAPELPKPVTPAPSHTTSAPLPSPAPPATAPASDSLMGEWCGDSLGLEFRPSQLAFVLADGERVEYRVLGYAAAGDVVTVHWRDQAREMVTEFGNFDSEGGHMTQIRGKAAADTQWQSYQRPFKRCP